jgi:hypothetical protein
VDATVLAAVHRLDCKVTARQFNSEQAHFIGNARIRRGRARQAR